MPTHLSAVDHPRRVRRIVVKLGTGVLTSGVGQLNRERLAGFAAQIAGLRLDGVDVIVVSSGAIGLGMGRLGLKHRPEDISKRQACAAVGQSLLMENWQHAFAPHGIVVAQVLLTHDELRLRHRHVAATATLEQLLAYQAVPIINENDAVSAAEIQSGSRFGDNDILSAMVASVTHAEYLMILSTVSGLIDRRGTGVLVPVVERITPEIEAMAEGTRSATSVGGMASKISAAKLALKAGCGVFIANGAEHEVMPRLLAGAARGTFFVPNGLPLGARKRWIAYFQRPIGTVKVNERAVPALRSQGRSLLAIGVLDCSGNFAKGDIVDIADPTDEIFARGVVAFGPEEIRRIAGKTSEEIQAIFPNRKRLEIVHRDNLVLL